MKAREFVCTDLGASDTRTVSDNGTVYLIPNNGVFVDNAERVDVAVKSGENPHDTLLGALDVTITKTSGPACEHFPCRVIMGDMGSRYAPNNVVPSVLQKKSEQRINYVSAILSVAHQRFVGAIGDEDINLYLALPPLEVKLGREEFGRLVGSYTVKFGRLGSEINVTIGSVQCFEESLMALVYFFFGTNGKKTEAAEKFKDFILLSIDIGASTTDIAAARDLRYIERSGQTYKTGCNVIRAALANYIRSEFGFDATDEQTNEVIKTGRLRMGSKYTDMSYFLRKAKMDFAESIVNMLQSYFRLINIPLQMIGAFVVSGGGSLASSYVDETGKTIVTTGPVSEYITEALNKIVSGIEVVNVEGDPRLANISGLFTRAKLDSLKAEKAS